MNTLNKILRHSIAGPFYRQHAGTFLFLFFILFGIQPSFNDALRTHYAFITGILTSFNFFLVALVCWTLYALKTIIFFRGCLQKEMYDFLFHLNALQPVERFILLLKLNVVLLAPISCYGLFIIGVALKDHHILTGLLIVWGDNYLTFFSHPGNISFYPKSKSPSTGGPANVFVPFAKNFIWFCVKIHFPEAVCYTNDRKTFIL
jgi:hypothetical protein